MLRSIFRSQRMHSLYRRFISLLANQKLVAGEGIEPPASAYETDELPLL